MADETNTDALRSFGAALRRARMEVEPQLTLVAVGSHPDAPRQWSHSYLSRVERGLELPKEELVHWYETRTGVPSGYLVDEYRRLIGYDQTPPEELRGRMRAWSIERMEIFADLTGERAVVYETRDLIATCDDASSHVLLMDTSDPTNDSSRYDVQVVEGGQLTSLPTWMSNTLAAYEVRFHRTFGVGEWHRVTLRHEFPSTVTIPRWMTVSTRRGETREAVITIAFDIGNIRPAYRIDELYPEEVLAAFGGASSERMSEVLSHQRMIVPDLEGMVRARFRTIKTGLHYGIGWL